VKSAESAVSSEPSQSARELLFEGIVAAATITLWPILGERSKATAASRATAMAWLPIAGFALGAILATIDRVAGVTLVGAARSIAVMLAAAILSGGLANRGLADTVESIRNGVRPASTGLARIGPIGAIAAIAGFAFEVWCLSRIGGTSRGAALVMSMMLSRWSIVPIGYGLKPLERWGLGVPYEGGLTFREFAVSSTIALGATMGLYRNIGLAVIIAIALTILAMRLIISRRMRGASGASLAGGCAIVEIATLAVLAALKIQ